MSFCRFETVKTDNSDTCRFYISREGFNGFPYSPFRFTKECLNTSKKNNYIKKLTPLVNEWRGERMIAMKYPKFYFC